LGDRVGYAEIAAYFRKQIDEGKLKPGDSLPSMKQVQDQFGVAANTANRAYKLLKTQGLTSSQWGGPTLVSQWPQGVVTGAGRIDRLEQTGVEYAPGESSTNHVAMVLSLKDPQLCRELDVDPSDEVVVRRRFFTQDGTVSIVAHSFTQLRAKTIVPEIGQQGQLKPFWHHTYEERTGQTIRRSPERILARLAGEDELVAFGIVIPATVAAPVLVARTTFYDDAGALDLWEDVYRPGLWKVSKS
jgi:DNA-binding GntR family transcriptional regulator